MAAYTIQRAGPPRSGRFSIGDTVTDGLGVIWECVRATSPRQWVVTNDPSGNGGAIFPGTGLSVIEHGSGAVNQTILTLTNFAQTITNGASEYTGTQIYTFPQGRLYIVGVTANIAPTTTTTLATTITTGSSGTVGIGTATASNAVLSGAMVTFLASTAFTSSTTVNVAAAAVGGVTAPASIDGHTTAAKMYLNTSVATNSADGVIAWNGTITVTWANLGVSAG